MQANEIIAINGILESEGPELNQNPPGTPPGHGEPGGASRFGVSVDALTDFNKSRGRPLATVQDIVNLTQDQAVEFYSQWVLPKMRFDELPSGVDVRCADVFTNLGPNGGVNLLELCVDRMPHTGKFDDQLLAAIVAKDPKEMIVAIGEQWIAKKRTQPGWAKYGRGWSARRERVDAQCIAMVSK
jgi:lysozyme family protein